MVIAQAGVGAPAHLFSQAEPYLQNQIEKLLRQRRFTLGRRFLVQNLIGRNSLAL